MLNIDYTFYVTHKHTYLGTIPMHTLWNTAAGKKASLKLRRVACKLNMRKTTTTTTTTSS